MPDTDNSELIIDTRTSDTLVKNVTDNLVLQSSVHVKDSKNVNIHTMESKMLVNKTVKDTSDSSVQEHSCSNYIVKRDLDYDTIRDVCDPVVQEHSRGNNVDMQVY